jgi:hypothetical protein
MRKPRVHDDETIDHDDPERWAQYDRRVEELVTLGADRGVARQIAGMETGIIDGDIEYIMVDAQPPKVLPTDARNPDSR